MRSRWRTPRTWFELALLLAAVVVIGINAPFFIGRTLEAHRLQRDGVAVSGVIVAGHGQGRVGSPVLVSYEFEGRWYESWVHCSTSRCAPTEAIELSLDPQRPDRFATEYGEINDDGRVELRVILVYTFGLLGLIALISLLRSPARGQFRR